MLHIIVFYNQRQSSPSSKAFTTRLRISSSALLYFPRNIIKRQCPHPFVTILYDTVMATSNVWPMRSRAQNLGSLAMASTGHMVPMFLKACTPIGEPGDRFQFPKPEKCKFLFSLFDTRLTERTSAWASKLSESRLQAFFLKHPHPNGDWNAGRCNSVSVGNCYRSHSLRVGLTFAGANRIANCPSKLSGSFGSCFRSIHLRFVCC